jgi:hypothetical protein
VFWYLGCRKLSLLGAEVDANFFYRPVGCSKSKKVEKHLSTYYNLWRQAVVQK